MDGFMKSKKFIVDFVGACFVLAIAFLILGMNGVSDVDLHVFLPLFFFVYALIHIVLFGVHYKDKEYSDLLLGIEGIVFGLGTVFLDVFETPKYLAFSILLWTLFWGLIKLKKADYFHDRKSKHWLVSVVSLLLFFAISVVVSMNLAYEVSVQILVIGFYLLFLGVFELYEAMFLSLTKGKLK